MYGIFRVLSLSPRVTLNNLYLWRTCGAELWCCVTVYAPSDSFTSLCDPYVIFWSPVAFNGILMPNPVCQPWPLPWPRSHLHGCLYISKMGLKLHVCKQDSWFLPPIPKSASLSSCIIHTTTSAVLLFTLLFSRPLGPPVSWPCLPRTLLFLNCTHLVLFFFFLTLRS